MNMDLIVNAYIADGGTRPATFLRGFADRGRYGVRGEAVGIPDEAADDYEAGGTAAQAAMP